MTYFGGSQYTQQELEQRYLADYVMTATPERRLLMLFARLKVDLHAATEAFEEGDFKRISDSLVHAQQIVFALRDPLDTTYEIGRNLHSLYSFCVNRLVQANVRKDQTLLPAVIDILERICDANEKAVVALEGASDAFA